MSRLKQPYYRNGPDHREGNDVSFGDILRTFGFRTATVGKWVTKEEQQIAANLFFDAFCDLMTILQVPEQVLSLNGELSIAFGKGGQKHSSAHYNAGTRTLALAKNAGGGALAHEWFHAFDHYICQKLFSGQHHMQFASAAWLDKQVPVNHSLNAMLEDCFQHIFLEPNSDKLSRLFLNSVAMDKSLKSFYYAQPQEVCARAFEAFIQDNQIKNAFLVQGTKLSDEAKLGVYPQTPQRPLINQLFSRYYATLGFALDKQSQGKND